MLYFCFQYGKEGDDIFGYAICDTCKSKLCLFTDETIKKYIDKFKSTARSTTFEEEMDYWLDFIKKDYVAVY